MRFTSPLLFVLATTAAACGGDDGPTVIPDGPIVTIDSSLPVVCPTDANYGTVTPTDGIAERDADAAPMLIQYSSLLNADPVFDVVALQLYKGFGAFATGEIGPATVNLTGDEINFATCGACVLVYGNVDPNNDFADEGTYLATGGTLTITSVSPNLTGTMSNVTLTHVTIDDQTTESTPVGDCNTTIESLAFDVPVTTAMMMPFTSSGKRSSRIPAR